MKIYSNIHDFFLKKKQRFDQLNRRVKRTLNR
jgi:hypothetical protein